MKVAGATGSPENTIEVTPAALSLAMTLVACSWSRAGSSVYDTLSASSMSSLGELVDEAVGLRLAESSFDSIQR